MSLSEELNKRLDDLKKAMTEYSNMVNSLETKKHLKETETSSLELKIEKLKKESDEITNRNILLTRKSNDEASEKTAMAKKLLEDAQIERLKVEDDKKKAQILFNEATALMVQAKQRQKEAENLYNQYEEKKKKLEAAVR